jgi:hypothetical protein
MEERTVRCANCYAMLQPNAEFCQKCGTATDPGLRRRRSGEPPEIDLKARRRKVLLVGAGIIFGSLMLGRAFSFADFNFDDDSHERNRRPVVVQAQELYQAYQNDEDQADERYGDRPLIVTGPFLRIVHDGQGNPDLRFDTSEPAMPLGADLVSRSFDASSELRPGQSVTLSCNNMAQTGDEHWLQSCSIERTGPVPPQPAIPPTPAPAPTPPSE